MKKVNKLLLSGLALFALPSSTLSNKNIKQNHQELNDTKGYFGQKEDASSDSQANTQPDIKDLAESSQLEYDHYKNKASDYIKEKNLDWQNLYATYVWDKIYKGLLKETSFEKKIKEYKKQISDSGTKSGDALYEIKLVNNIKDDLIKKYYSSSFKKQVTNIIKENYKSIIKKYGKLTNSEIKKAFYNRYGQSIRVPSTASKKFELTSYVYNLEIQKFLKTKIGKEYFKKEQAKLINSKIPKIDYFANIDYGTIKDSFASYKKWAEWGLNAKYAFHFFKGTTFYEKAFKGINKKLKQLGHPPLSKDEWDLKIDEYYVKPPVTTKKPSNVTEYIDVYIRDYFKTHMYYIKRNPYYMVNQQVFHLWIQLCKVLYPEKDLENSKIADDFALIAQTKKALVEKYLPNLKAKDKEIKKNLIANNSKAITKLAVISKEESKSRAFEKWYKDKANDEQLMFELSRDWPRFAKVRSRYTQAWTWRGTAYYMISQNSQNKNNYAKKLALFRQWKKTTNGKKVLKSIFYTNAKDFRLITSLDSKPYNPTKLKIKEAMTLGASDVYDKFIDTLRGKEFYKIAEFKTLIAKMKETKYIDIENDGLKANVYSENKKSLNGYKTWIDQDINRKYSLEFFKKSKYTAIAIKSFNARVKKANGKLGGNLTKEEWFKEIDKFAKKTKITTLSRVGNYTREQWYEIYIRDYFATYIRNIKKSETFSMEQYNFFIYQRIYQNILNKIKSSREDIKKVVEEFKNNWASNNPPGEPVNQGQLLEVLRENISKIYNIDIHNNLKIEIKSPDLEAKDFAIYETKMATIKAIEEIIKTFNSSNKKTISVEYNPNKEEKENLLFTWYKANVEKIAKYLQDYKVPPADKDEIEEDVYIPGVKNQWKKSPEYKKFVKFKAANDDTKLISQKHKELFNDWVNDETKNQVANGWPKNRMHEKFYNLINWYQDFDDYAKKFYSTVATIKDDSIWRKAIIDQYRFKKLDDFLKDYWIDNVKFSREDFSDWFTNPENNSNVESIYKQNLSKYKGLAQQKAWDNIKEQWNSTKSKEVWDKAIYKHSTWDSNSYIKKGWDYYKYSSTEYYTIQAQSYAWWQVYNALMNTPFDQSVNKFKKANNNSQGLKPNSVKYEIDLRNSVVDGAKETLLKKSSASDEKRIKDLMTKYPEKGELTLKEKRALVEQKYHDLVWVYRKLQIEKNWKKFLDEDSWLKGKYNAAKKAKFVKSTEGKALINIEIAKDIIPKLKTLSTFYVDISTHMLDKKMEIDISHETYLKWVKEKENKKYALEFFKNSKYTDIAIKSFNARVKKAKGKLGGNLTKEEYFQKIDEFAKKTKITTLSRVGNYTREQWFEIYIRDYFATYMKYVKKSKSFARDLYSYFVWDKIYNVMSLDNNGINTLRKNIRKEIVKFKANYLKKNPEAKGLTTDQLKETSYYYESWMNTQKQMLKQIYPESSFEKFMKPVVPDNFVSFTPQWTKVKTHDSWFYYEIKGSQSFFSSHVLGKVKDLKPNEDDLAPYLLNWGCANIEKMIEAINNEKNTEINKAWKASSTYKQMMKMYNDGEKVLMGSSTFTLPPTEKYLKKLQKKYFAIYLQTDFYKYEQYRDFLKKLYKVINGSGDLYTELKKRYNYVKAFEKLSLEKRKGMYQWYEMHSISKVINDLLPNKTINTKPTSYQVKQFGKQASYGPIIRGMYANSKDSTKYFEKWEKAGIDKWLGKEVNLLRLDEYKNALKNWIDSKVDLGKYASSSQIANNVDLYINEIKRLKDFELYQSNPFEEFDFKNWIFSPEIMKMLEENVYTKSNDNKIWDGWKTSSNYQDALDEINLMPPLTETERNNILLKHFKVYGDFDNKDSSKYKAAFKVFETSNLVYGNNKIEFLPKTKINTHYSKSKFSQQEVYWMEWLDGEIKNSDQIKKLFSNILVLKKYGDYKRIRFTSYNQFWTSAWNEWTKTKEAQDMFLKKIKGKE